MLLPILWRVSSRSGIEFAGELCREAENNLDSFALGTGKHFEASVLCVDAACYPVNDHDCVFFLNNPFKRKVLEQVLGNIRQSPQSKPLFNPHRLRESGPPPGADHDPFWRTAGETTSGGLETYVYYQPR